MAQFFLYGTLRDEALLSVVTGLPRERLSPSAAILPGWEVRRVAGADWPFIRRAAGGVAHGVLVEGLGEEAVARLAYYEGAHRYRLGSVCVTLPEAHAPAEALAFLPLEESQPDGGMWDFPAWLASDRGLAAEAAREIMDWHGRRPAEDMYRLYPQFRMRAQARLTARKEAPVQGPGTALGRADVAAVPPARPYAEYFAIEHHRLRHRLHGGGQSDEVARAVFMMGDAVTVLPWDPESDHVLMVEQFRAGPWARGDTRPWLLEPVAGRRDPGESPEQAALREMEEEAGISRARLHRIAGYYPSPGAVSEYLEAYVAACDLSGAGGVFGRDDEGEDIRAIVLPLAEAQAAAADGAIRSGPLLLSLSWLALNKAELVR